MYVFKKCAAKSCPDEMPTKAEVECYVRDSSRAGTRLIRGINNNMQRNIQQYDRGIYRHAMQLNIQQYVPDRTQSSCYNLEIIAQAIGTFHATMSARHHPQIRPGSKTMVLIGRSNRQKAESPSCFRYASKYSMGAEGDDITMASKRGEHARVHTYIGRGSVRGPPTIR